ncbi:hypothetical protein [Cellulomonas wangsupingiae]|uniref:hypothetical protein n=1 Tax=Cellulomonas wangsupingiae TaxID=2968085 RepID=UPI001D0EE1EC|nr:hypothetical protein [Cellulomonas wangsupingiae]MCM0638463.1 hypothetical protein [Cellulomonas wangsupingiae]
MTRTGPAAAQGELDDRVPRGVDHGRSGVHLEPERQLPVLAGDEERRAVLVGRGREAGVGVQVE